MFRGEFGRVLYTEQIEAGLWEVVLEELPDEPVALRFFRFLLESTDTFDPVMVEMALQGGYSRPDEDQMRSLVVAFERSEGRPAPFADPMADAAAWIARGDREVAKAGGQHV